MKKTTSLVRNLLVCSTLFLGVPVVSGHEIVVERLDATSSYCHMKFPPMREETLSWEQPLLNENAGNTIDFYGPCDHNPVGQEEIRTQRRALRDGYQPDGE